MSYQTIIIYLAYQKHGLMPQMSHLFFQYQATKLQSGVTRNDGGILVQRDPVGKARNSSQVGILGMNISSKIPEFQKLLDTIIGQEFPSLPDIDGRIVKIAGKDKVNIPAWSTCTITVTGPHYPGDAIVEPLDEPLCGGLVLQTGLVGSIQGCFQVSVLNPTANDVWLQPHSPVGRLYAVDVISIDHQLDFQEQGDSLHIDVTPRQVVAKTQRVSSQQVGGISVLPKGQPWMADLDIGKIPAADQRHLVEMLDRNQMVFAQNDDDVGLTHTVKHHIHTVDDAPVKSSYRRIPPPQFEEVKAHLSDLMKKGVRPQYTVVFP